MPATPRQLTLLHVRALAAISIAVACSGGCAWFNRDGPVPKSVAQSRQLSARGLSALDRGQWDNAERLLAQAVKTCPADATARRYYAEALWKRSAANDALEQLNEAIRLSADEPALYVRAGEMYLSLSRYDEALQHVQQALDMEPQLASAWKLRAAINDAAGDSEQSLADLHKALNYRRDDPELLLQTAELYRKLGRPQRALATLQSLIDTYPRGEEPQQPLFLQGLALVALERHAEAIDAYTLATKRGQPTGEMLYRLGEVQLLAGRYADAEASLRQALVLQPDHPPSLALLQRTQVAQRDNRQIR